MLNGYIPEGFKCNSNYYNVQPLNWNDFGAFYNDEYTPLLLE